MIEDAWGNQKKYPLSREEFIVTAKSIQKDYIGKDPELEKYETVRRLARLYGQTFHDIEWKLNNWVK